MSPSERFLRPGSVRRGLSSRSHPGRHGGRSGLLEALDGEVGIVRFAGCRRTVPVPLARLRAVAIPNPRGSNHA